MCVRTSCITHTSCVVNVMPYEKRICMWRDWVGLRYIYYTLDLAIVVRSARIQNNWIYLQAGQLSQLYLCPPEILNRTFSYIILKERLQADNVCLKKNVQCSTCVGYQICLNNLRNTRRLLRWKLWQFPFTATFFIMFLHWSTFIHCRFWGRPWNADPTYCATFVAFIGNG